MRKNKLIILLFILLALLQQESRAQVYFLTTDILKNTKYIRKKQTAHSIQSAYREDGKLVINFVATLDKKKKAQPYHLVLKMDSVLANFNPQQHYPHEFDSATARKLNVLSMDRSYQQIFRYGNNRAYGIEIMCFKEIITPGFYSSVTAGETQEKITILDARRDYYFELSHKTRTYLKGPHIVLLYYPSKPIQVNGKDVDYLLLNIENGPKINKWNYLKLPFAAILDTIFLPFVLMVSGMEK
ncbi:MAG: hypothetical protein JNM19_07825 [Chitinophagaceae bacterium]|nr:hypothetical protein [Chitinophagaceae bacterium]